MISLNNYINEEVKQKTEQGGVFTFGKNNYLSYFNEVITVPTSRTDAIEIETLFVTERNKGVGTKLVKSCIEYAKSVDKDIVLYASPLGEHISEEDLIKFYKKLGFEEDNKGIDKNCLVYKIKGEA